MSLHCLCFFLYSTLGKGFAYLGYQPFFVGEVLLATGLCVAVGTRRLSRLSRSPIGITLLLFALWEMACTIPYLTSYGIDTLRDAMLWVYSSFAWIIAAIVLRLPDTLTLVVSRYQKYVAAMIAILLLAFLATAFAPNLPHWPGTEITVPMVKPGDANVHFGAAVAFVIVGFRVRRLWWLVPAVVGATMASALSRGGLLACVGCIGISAFVFPKLGKFIPALLAIGFAFTFAMLVDLRINTSGAAREFSARQVVENVVSALGSNPGIDDAGELQGTKEWRLKWWNAVIDYTLHGPYFWTGKGFGVNLAVDDNISMANDREHTLRSPHNSNLTVLARSGVPGAALWAILQVTWATTIWRACQSAKHRGDRAWAALFGWLLAYWIAFLINANFDVSLEGPVCGIPFWTIVGLGWGGVTLYQRSVKAMLTASKAQQAWSRAEQADFPF